MYESVLRARSSNQRSHRSPRQASLAIKQSRAARPASGSSTWDRLPRPAPRRGRPLAQMLQITGEGRCALPARIAGLGGAPGRDLVSRTAGRSVGKLRVATALHSSERATPSRRSRRRTTRQRRGLAGRGGGGAALARRARPALSPARDFSNRRIAAAKAGPVAACEARPD
jgi:hypothetical protein